MDISELSLFKVDKETTFKPFDCGDTDLNDFLIEKSIFYKSEFLSTTYVLEDSERTVAFFSIFNDSLHAEEGDFASKSAFQRFLKELVSHPKRHHKSFPAIKVGRLAVCKDAQGKGIGKMIMDYIIDLAINHNEACGCKLITVDAYASALEFYTNLKFDYLTPKDSDSDTRQMFLDLSGYNNN